MKLTDEQQQAVRIDKHISLEANAGSGKTAVLTRRYVEIILHHLRQGERGVIVPSIVAITFTRKAASEMRQRVAEALDKALADEANRPIWPWIKLNREMLSSARISTIHSFCSRLIREYPVESGIPPRTQEISETEKAQLRHEAVRTTVARYLSRDEEVVFTRKEAVEDLCKRYGLQWLLAAVAALVQSSEDIEQLNALYTRNSDAQIAKLHIDNLRKTLRPSLLSLIETMTSSLTHRLGPKANENIRITFAMTLPALADRLRNPQIELYDILAAAPVVTDLFTKTGTLKKQGLTGSMENTTATLWAIQGVNAAAAPVLAALHDMLSKDSDSSHEAHLQSIADSRVLLSVATEAHMRFNEHKKERRFIDFDDQQLRAYELLKNADIAAAIRQKVRYLMVDEFQDTNDLQYNIVSQLSGILQTESSQPTSNVFIVGDPKQSIYGFRGADVRVFSKATRDLQAVNHSQGLDEARLLLTTSFRLLPVISATVNHICSSAFDGERSEFDVPYTPLVCGRQIEQIHENNGSVRLYLTELRKEEESNISAEADVIASVIVEYLQNNVTWERNADGKEVPRPLTPSDIAVLARTTTNFSTLTSALNRAGVPVRVTGSRMFWSKQEIHDIVSMISFLHDPSDDVSLAAVLRSPFGCLGDQELSDIAHTDGGGTLWERLSRYAADNTNASPLARQSATAISDLLALAAHLPAAPLLRTVLDRSGYRARATSAAASEQEDANIEKLINIARNFESQGFRNLHDLAKELRQWAEQELQESEANTSGDRAAVSVMTVHASKGLEFPVVFLFDTNRSSPNAKVVEWNTSMGIAFSVPPEGTPSFITRARKRTLSRSVIYGANANREEAEQRRLLYVALTRARDHLVISIALKQRKEEKPVPQGEFARMLFRGLGMDTELSIFAQQGQRPIHTELDILTPEGEKKKASVTIPLSVHVRADIDVRPPEPYLAHPGEQREEIPVPPLLLATPKVRMTGEKISASQLMAFEKDPQRFILLYRFGFDEADLDDDGDAPRNANDDDKGSDAGTVMHSAFENIKRWLTADGTIRTEVLRNTLAAAARLAELDTATAESIIDRAMREIPEVCSTPFVASYRNILLSSSTITEKRLYYPLGNSYLRAVLDVLTQGPDGTPEVWDWKTNSLTGTDTASLAAAYDTQLKVYLWLVSQLYPQKELFRARLLFTGATKNTPEEWIHTIEYTREQIATVYSELLHKVEALLATGYTTH